MGTRCTMLRLFPVLTASLAVLLGTLRLAEGQTGTFSGKPDGKYEFDCPATPPAVTYCQLMYSFKGFDMQSLFNHGNKNYNCELEHNDRVTYPTATTMTLIRQGCKVAKCSGDCNYCKCPPDRSGNSTSTYVILPDGDLVITHSSGTVTFEKVSAEPMPAADQDPALTPWEIVFICLGCALVLGAIGLGVGLMLRRPVESEETQAIVAKVPMLEGQDKEPADPAAKPQPAVRGSDVLASV